MPDYVPQVHTVETSARSNLPIDYRILKRKKCESEFYKTALLYEYLDGIESKNRAGQMNNCRSYAWFIRNKDTGQLRVASNACRLRWCPICSTAKQYHLTEAVTAWLHTLKRSRFVTLTYKHSNAPLEHQIKSLYSHFRLFRQRSKIKRLIRGGIWFFQIKKTETHLSQTGKNSVNNQYSPPNTRPKCLSKSAINDITAESFHPHIHILVDSDFLPHKIISEEWLKCTKTSMVVDIRAVKDRKKAAEYVARYSARPSNLSDLSYAEAIAVITALHGKRIVGKWGTAGGIHLSAQQFSEAERWIKVGNWKTCLLHYHTDIRAKLIVDAWQTDSTLSPNVSFFDHETNEELAKMDDWYGINLDKIELEEYG